MFSRFSLFVSCGMVFLAAVACLEDWLPGGAVRDLSLPVVCARSLVWDDPGTKGIAKGDSVLRAFASFVPANYEIRRGEALVVDVRLSQRSVDDSWEVLRIMAYVGGVESETKANLTMERSDDPYVTTGYWRNIDINKHYTLRVLLHQRNPKVTAEQMKAMIDGTGEIEQPLKIKPGLFTRVTMPASKTP